MGIRYTLNSIHRKTCIIHGIDWIQNGNKTLQSVWFCAYGEKRWTHYQITLNQFNLFIKQCYTHVEMGNYDVLTTKRYYNSPNEMEDKDKDYKSKCIIIIILRKKHMNSARKSKFNRSIHNGSEWISAFWMHFIWTISIL